MKKAIYAGSFDPITNGHLDILNRALDVFDEVTLLLAINPSKKSTFTVEERLEMMRESTKDLKGVNVDFTEGLSVVYAKEHGSRHMIRGLRAVTDFEYEFQLAAANRYIDPEVDDVFFMAGSETSFISSSSINSMHEHGVDISRVVPKAVIEAYRKKESK